MAAYKRDKPSGPLGRALPTGKTVPISTFAALFSELISYHRARTASLAELESKLSDAGYGVGYRMFEMFSLRTGKRELDVISAMKLVSGPLWTQLFGRTADHLDVNKEAAVPECTLWSARAVALSGRDSRLREATASVFGWRVFLCRSHLGKPARDELIHLAAQGIFPL